MEKKMKISEKNISVRELVDGFIDDEENGAKGYGNRLNIRPQYQREFVYNDDEQKAVVDSVMHNYPLNIMYWSLSDEGADTEYEMLDGQQRTLSICNYYDGNFSYDNGTGEAKYFFNLTPNEQKRFLDYELTIYVCDGEPEEKLAWFKVINVKGEELNEQERRNAVYSGSFVSDARRWFAKRNCQAYRLSKDIIGGSAIRQDLLQKALQWITKHEARMEGRKAVSIEEYMALHQQDKDAKTIEEYFADVVNWALDNFNVKKFKSIMKDIDWPYLYDNYHNQKLDKASMEKRISELLMQADSKDPDYEIGKPKGIIPYVLSGNEQLLELRTFSDKVKLAAYERQHHRCNICGKEFKLEEMEADHIVPWAKGGRTEPSNCQMLCRDCNRRKSDKTN